MSSVRDIIVEAAARANVCPRKRALPEDIFVGGLNLFDGVMQEFSNKSYVDAYKSSVDFNPHTETVTVGLEGSDVSAPRIQLPRRVLYKYPGAVDWTPMDFISYDDFYSCLYTDYIVSWQPVGANQFALYFKPRFLTSNPQCRLIYNLEMHFEDGDVVNLPTPYVELVTRNLAYKMAVKWPRVDESKKASLKTEADDLEKSLTATNASMRIITRGGTVGGSMLADMRSGAFISNRYF
jgi:hypothetical protein